MDLTLEFGRNETTQALEDFLKQAESFHRENSKVAFRNWHSEVLAFLKESFTSNNVADNFYSEAHLRLSAGFWSGMTEEDKISSYDLAKARKFIRFLLRELDKPLLQERAPATQGQSTPVHSGKVFVVHGHSEEMVQKTARLLEGFNLIPVILHEQANMGKTIIEKFERNSDDVGYAIVLMTADDMGSKKADAQKGSYTPRARQNVLMELGYFMGKLGRGKVCVLKESGVEVPSDIFGVVYEEIDSAGAWKTRVGKELKTAGFDVDLNKL